MLGEGQNSRPSCAGQAVHVRELMDWGTEFKTYRPPVGDFSAMHAKSWVCDGEVYLGGSVNFTPNGINRNEEHLLIIKEAEVITTYLEWFEQLWLAGTVVVGRTS